MNLQQCPYDGESLTAEAFGGGFAILSCERCGAAWELHNNLVRRVLEPEWDQVRDAATEPGVGAETPDRGITRPERRA